MPTYEEDPRVGEVRAAQQRLLSTEEQVQISQLKDLEQELLSCLNRIGKQKGGGTRYLSLAQTNIQQGIMWALREIVGDLPSG